MLLIAAILFLDLQKKAGWSMSLADGLIVASTNSWIHILRGITSNYWLGTSIGLIVVVLGLIPTFKQRLFD